jgi:DNA-binding LytR/AlgR family response regulator
MKRIRLIDEVSRITHLSGEANYTRIHMASSPDLIVCKTLSMCVDELPGFLRIHKKYAINPQFFQKAILVDSKTANVLVSDKLLPISRRRLKEVLADLWRIDAIN